MFCERWDLSGSWVCSDLYLQLSTSDHSGHMLTPALNRAIHIKCSPTFLTSTPLVQVSLYWHHTTFLMCSRLNWHCRIIQFQSYSHKHWAEYAIYVETKRLNEHDSRILTIEGMLNSETWRIVVQWETGLWRVPHSTWATHTSTARHKLNMLKWLSSRWLPWLLTTWQHTGQQQKLRSEELVKGQRQTQLLSSFFCDAGLSVKPRLLLSCISDASIPH